jgi:hypothetical protein
MRVAGVRIGCPNVEFSVTMPHVRLSNRVRTRLVIGAALGAGTVGGLLLFPHGSQEYDFLRGTKPIAVRNASVVTSGGVIHGTTTYFSFEGDWKSVYDRARREMPDAIVRDATVGGAPAKVLTVPRFEAGRMRVFFPPVREITILPQHLVLTEGGQMMAEEDVTRRWASVKISEYHEPHVLESAVNWVRDHIDI